MKVKVILNPYANRWGAQTQEGALQAMLSAAKYSCDMTVTQEPGEAIDIAEAAVHEGYDVVVAAGGDGTINEVINGLARAAGDGPMVPFGIFPFGTANDFYTITGLPDTLKGAASVIAGGHTRYIDLGQVNDRYFINNSAVAMEPTVTLESMRIHRLSGELRYFVALIKAIFKLKAWDMSIEWDGGSIEGPTFLLSVCNSHRTGGFTIAPGAVIDDGQFDVVYVPEVPKIRVIGFLLRLMQGRHTEYDWVTFTRMTGFRLTSNPGTPIHSDGEIFSESITKVEYKIHPGKIPLLSPQ